MARFKTGGRLLVHSTLHPCLARSVMLSAFVFVAFAVLCVEASGQLGSLNPAGPFADSIERRRAEQDLRALPLKQRERIDRNLSDPQKLKQMNEDFLRIQAIRVEMVKILSSGSMIKAQQLKESAGDIRRRATRLRTMLALSDKDEDIEIRPEQPSSLESVNRKAFLLCLEISRFTGNPLFRKKGVITVGHAKEAGEAIEAVIELAGAVQKESARLTEN